MPRKRPDRPPAPTRGALAKVEPTRDALDEADSNLILGLLDIPADEKDPVRWLKRNLFVANAFGNRAAGSLLRKPDPGASQLLHHRARVVLRDGAALLAPRYLDELMRAKPNSARLDGIWKLLKAAGVVSETSPVDPRGLAAAAEESLEFASKSREEMAAHILARVRAGQARAGQTQETPT